jgi:hypothetical protein
VPPISGGFGFPLGFLAAILATAGAVAAGATVHPDREVIALACVCAALASLSTGAASVATAVVGWALHAGFVLGRHGDLALTGPAARDAVVLGAVTLVAYVLAVVIRRERARAPHIPAQRGASQPVS